MLPDNLSSLRVVDLKAELVKRKLPTKGKKDELVARLQQWIAEGNEGPDDQENDQTSESASAPEQTGSVLEAPPKKEELVEAPTPDAPTAAATVAAPSAEQKEPAPAPAAVQTKAEHDVVAEEPSAPAREPEKTPESVDTTSAVAAVSPSPPKEPVKAPQGERGEKRKREEEKEEEKHAKEEAHEKRSKTEPASNAVGDQEQQTEEIKSNAVYIKGFVRPLIIRQVQELIKQYGEVKRFWMDSIKTHCYVIYAETAQAVAAHKGINGIVFPEDRGRKLTVGGLTPDQAETLIEHEQKAAERQIKPDWEALIVSACKGELSKGDNTTANVPEGRRPRLQGISQITRELQKAATASPTVGTESAHSATVAVEERTIREVESGTAALVPETPAPPAAPTASLDELFRKTTTLPHLYYLPVPQQVAQQRLDKFQQRSSA